MRARFLDLLFDWLSEGLKNGDKKPLNRWDLIKEVVQVGLLVYLVLGH